MSDFIRRETCLYCCGPLPEYAGRGRPRSYCTDACASEAEGERDRLRRRITRLEEEATDQVGRFVFPTQRAEPKLMAARQRLRDLLQW